MKKTTDTTDRCSQIMSRIESEQISPCPRWHFMCVHYGVWLLWAASVVIGAVAVAVMLYVGNHVRFGLYEATHNTPLAFFVGVLPYLWIALFVMMAGFAYYNLRCTKRGYRYKVTHILLSSVAVSLVGGVVLHSFGVGFVIDQSLSKGMPHYPSLERMEMKMWQNPAEGRLVGTFIMGNGEDMQYQFLDKNSATWTVAVVELREVDRELLTSGQPIRLLGTTTDFLEKQFHACGAFPWLFDAMPAEPARELAEHREMFIRRMYDHMETGDRLKAIEQATFASTSEPDGKPFMDGHCAEIAAVKRIKFYD